jgi:hypothetical protein
MPPAAFPPKVSISQCLSALSVQRALRRPAGSVLAIARMTFEHARIASDRPEHEVVSEMLEDL